MAFTVRWREALRKLYACASPKCKGRIEETEFEMLIDSGAELCLMSKEVFEELDLPIDLTVNWSVGAANNQRTKAYGICHDVEVTIGGIVTRCRFFVLENLSQDIILGRPWERLVRAKHDNRDDGSCYTTIHDERGNSVTFCSVPAHHERNRSEARPTKVYGKLEGKDKKEGRSHHSRNGKEKGYASDAWEEVHVDDQGEVFTLKAIPEKGDVRMIEGRITHVGFELKSYASDRDRTQRKFLEARTLYKCKKDKIRPANQQHTGGIKSEGSENWKKLLIGLPCPENKKYPWLIPKFSDIERGSRLTPERIEKLKIGKGITKEEREVLIEVLFSREKGIAFDFTEKGVFKPEVEPPHVIPTIAHEPWQVANFRVPKALEGEVIEIIRKKLECGALERCCGPYRNPWFLVPKKDKGY